MQLVEYINQVQGAITSITSVVEIEMNLILSGGVHNVMLTQLEGITNHLLYESLT
jgi:hypothetical protein